MHVLQFHGNWFERFFLGIALQESIRQSDTYVVCWKKLFDGVFSSFLLGFLLVVRVRLALHLLLDHHRRVEPATITRHSKTGRISNACDIRVHSQWLRSTTTRKNCIENYTEKIIMDTETNHH